MEQQGEEEVLEVTRQETKCMRCMVAACNSMHWAAGLLRCYKNSEPAAGTEDLGSRQAAGVWEELHAARQAVQALVGNSAKLRARLGAGSKPPERYDKCAKHLWKRLNQLVDLAKMYFGQPPEEMAAALAVKRLMPSRREGGMGQGQQAPPA